MQGNDDDGAGDEHSPVPFYCADPPLPVFKLPTASHESLYAIWDPDHVMQLRKCHRLVGDLAGTLPKHISQSAYLSVPLILNHEEVMLGVRANLLQVFADTPQCYLHPDASAIDAFNKQRHADIDRQVEETIALQSEKREKLSKPDVRASRKRKRDVGLNGPNDLGGANEHPDSDELHGRDANASQHHSTKHPKANNSTSLDVHECVATHSLRNGARCNGQHQRIPKHRGAPVSAAGAAAGDEKSEDDDGVNEPAQKAARLGLFSRFSARMRHILNSIFVPSQRLALPPPPPHPLENCERQENDADGDENSHVVETPAASKSADKRVVRVNENMTSEEREAARKKVLDLQAHHQARQASLVITATAAREDEEGERPLEHVTVPSGMCQRRAQARQAVFDDLHARGYYLTCGAKFGTDFLAYAADPQVVHAALAVVVMDGDEDISARDVVAWGRLGDAVRKRTVLAWTEESREGKAGHGEAVRVEYVGVQWDETLP